MSVYKMNCLSVPASILSYMIQNTADVLHITTLDIKNEKIMWIRFIFIYRYNNSCTDNEEEPWLLWLQYDCFMVP